MRGNLEMALIQRDLLGGSTTVSIAMPVTMMPMSDTIYQPPMISFSFDDAQQIIDELWRCGIRPSESVGTGGAAGALAATERHLADMKNILFHKLGILGNESAKK